MGETGFKEEPHNIKDPQEFIQFLVQPLAQAPYRKASAAYVASTEQFAAEVKFKKVKKIV